MVGLLRAAWNELGVAHQEARSFQARQDRPRLVDRGSNLPLPDVPTFGARQSTTVRQDQETRGVAARGYPWCPPGSPKAAATWR